MHIQTSILEFSYINEDTSKMVLVKAKGYEFEVAPVRNTYSRRAQQFKNNILNTLKIIGLTEDDVIVDLEPVAIKNIAASASWYVDGYHLHYSYNGLTKYVENLYVVSKLIEFEVKAVIEGKKTIDEFIKDFTEEHDVQEERKAARETMGVDADCLDLDLINKKYKKMAMELHPDRPDGDTEKFKALNRAHKILKRELE